MVNFVLTLYNFMYIMIAQYMKLKLFLFLSIIFFLVNSSFAQSEGKSTKDSSNKSVLLPTTILADGERVPWVLLPGVQVYGKRTFASEKDRLDYRRLRYNVLKVLPYARVAHQKYDQLQRDLAVTSNKREQKRLIKTCEREIKEIFNKDIKNMSVTQGKILVKLLDREIGNSSFEMVKELRGGVSAFFYQSLARVFGHNLKNEFNIREDREIENIIRQHDGLPAYY